MEMYKLKIKVGEHEFEAEGPTDVVKSQFEAFKELIASAALISTANKALALPQSMGDNPTSANESALALDKVTRTDGRVISLTAHPPRIEDGLLVLLLGQRMLRQNDSVTGGELLDGLRQSGMNVGRIDWRLDKMASEGQVIKIGVGRASRYRLTNQGMKKAEGIARDLIALVP